MCLALCGDRGTGSQQTDQSLKGSRKKGFDAAFKRDDCLEHNNWEHKCKCNHSCYCGNSKLYISGEPKVKKTPKK